MGQGDVHPLHGPAGARAATWFDSQNEVCWFLGFSPAHDYGLFEARAEARELLPSEDDETLLELEQEEHDFELRLGPGLVKLVDTAIKSPGNPARGTVGALMRVEVSAIAIEVYGRNLVDLTLIVHLPIVIARAVMPPDWPGQERAARSWPADI